MIVTCCRELDNLKKKWLPMVKSFRKIRLTDKSSVHEIRIRLSWKARSNHNFQSPVVCQGLNLLEVTFWRRFEKHLCPNDLEKILAEYIHWVLQEKTTAALHITNSTCLPHITWSLASSQKQSCCENKLKKSKYGITT